MYGTDFVIFLIRSFPLKNTGQVVMSYEWLLLQSRQHSDSSSSEKSMKNENRKEEDVEDITPFSVHPTKGEIPPGQEQLITVRFTPEQVLSKEESFRCR